MLTPCLIARAVGYAAPDVVSSPTASQAASLDLPDRTAPQPPPPPPPQQQQQQGLAQAASPLLYGGAHNRHEEPPFHYCWFHDLLSSPALGSMIDICLEGQVPTCRLCIIWILSSQKGVF